MLGTPFKIVNFLRNADNYTPAHYSIKVFIQEMLKIEKKIPCGFVLFSC